MTGVLQLTVLAWCVFAGASAALGSLAYPMLRSHLRDVAPVARARWLSVLAAAPWVLSTATAFACFAPSLGTRLVGLSDHCMHHDELHAHFCWVHPAPYSGSAVGWLIAAAALLGVLAVLAADAVRLARASRRAQALAGYLEERTFPFVSGAPLAFTVGLLRPRTVIARSLAARLSGAELTAVVAHERAHVERRDNLRKVIASVMARLHAPRTRALLLADLDLACEEACDRCAAAATGDPLIVADAILAAERLGGADTPAPMLASAFSASVVEARVEALLRHDEGARDRDLRLGPWICLTGALVMCAAIPLHDVLEDLVSLLGK